MSEDGKGIKSWGFSYSSDEKSLETPTRTVTPWASVWHLQFSTRLSQPLWIPGCRADTSLCVQKSLWKGSHQKIPVKNTVLSITPFSVLPEPLPWHRHAGVTHLMCDTPDMWHPHCVTHTPDMWHTWCMTNTPDVWHPWHHSLLQHLTLSGELSFTTAAGQISHKHYTQRHTLTFVQRPLCLYPFREWN